MGSFNLSFVLTIRNRRVFGQDTVTRNERVLHVNPIVHLPLLRVYEVLMDIFVFFLENVTQQLELTPRLACWLCLY